MTKKDDAVLTVGVFKELMKENNEVLMKRVHVEIHNEIEANNKVLRKEIRVEMKEEIGANNKVFRKELREEIHDEIETSNHLLKREIRDEIHSVVSSAVVASERRMIAKMDNIVEEIQQLRTGVIDLLDDGVLPQVETNRLDILLLKRSLAVA